MRPTAAPRTILAASGALCAILAASPEPTTKWAREIGCAWNEETCAGAAEGGHLEVLKWARANGCPWDEDTRRLARRKGYVES